MLLISICIASPAALAEAHRPNFAIADSFAHEAVETGEIPSVAYAIARDGQVLHAMALGKADRERDVPATLRTAYALASVTKPITATALRVLQQQAGPMLDTPISTALPSLAPPTSVPDPLQGVTLDRLLHHTSGLGTYARILYGDDIAPAAAQIAEAQRPYLHPTQTPGRIAEYSNIGYGLIGDVIAAHGGMSFADYVQRSVFAPLEMRDAFIAGTTSHAGAIAYDTKLAPLPPMWNDTPGAGNAFASVEDLLRFGTFHLDPARFEAMAAQLPPSAVLSMRRPDADGAHHPMYGDAWYGHGWYVRGPAATPQLMWHEGGMPGASTLIALYPQHGLVVTVLVNRSDAQPFVHTLATHLLHAAWPEAPALALDPIADFAPLDRSTPFRGNWTGTILVDGHARAASLHIAPDGENRFEYQSGTDDDATPTVRSFQAIARQDSLVSAVQGPWHSTDAPKGATALLLKLSRRDDDTLEGAVVAYDGPDRLRFLLPYALSMTRIGTAAQGLETPPKD